MADPTRLPHLKTRALLFTIVLIALLLRLWGIDWGLPNATRFFSFHPDETVVVGFSLRLNPFIGQLDPGFYNYGSLSLLLNAVVLRAGEALGMSGSMPGVPSAEALLAVRLLTAALGAGTCFFLCGTGRLLFGTAAGWTAASLYAVAPLAVQHGHFATVDVPATFWLTGALFFAARALREDTDNNRSLLWAGLWSGLAAAAKYNAGLVLLAGAAVWWLRTGGGKRSGKGAAFLLGGAALGFVLGCPGALLNPSGLWQGIAYEAGHAGQGHGFVFVNTPHGLLYHVFFNLRWGLGAPLLLLALLAVAAACVRRRPADLVLLAFVVPYYLLIGFAQVKFARYTLPLLPPLFLLTGALLVEGTKPRLGRIATGALVASAIYALVFSLALDATMTRPDPRDRAAAFIRSRPGIASVGFAYGPWFNAPPLHPGLAAPNPRAAQRFAAEATNPRLIPSPEEWSADLLAATRPDAVALSEIEYTDALRVGQPTARKYLAALRRGYPDTRIFASPVQVFGLRFTNGAGELPRQGLPHDMLYTNPTVVIFLK